MSNIVLNKFIYFIKYLLYIYYYKYQSIVEFNKKTSFHLNSGMVLILNWHTFNNCRIPWPTQRYRCCQPTVLACHLRHLHHLRVMTRISSSAYTCLLRRQLLLGSVRKNRKISTYSSSRWQSLRPLLMCLDYIILSFLLNDG